MAALLFTLALFAFFGCVGYAALALFPPRLRLVQGMLLAPTLGIAVTVLPVFFLNRLGMPVKDFGAILLPALAAAAAVVLLVKRPAFPLRRSLPYLGILVVALLLAAWPMLGFGFDWLAYGNDDMANYCLAAQRFYHHGFFDDPDARELMLGREYSLAYWFLHVGNNVRAGADLVLAALWAFTGLNAIQIFMPVIMALHLALLAASGAVVAGRGMPAKAPMIAMSLLALSPLTTIGSLYQLIGQVGGLALLCAAVTLLYRLRPAMPLGRRVGESVPAAVVCAAIFVWYPEALPFLGLGWIVYLILVLRKDASRAVGVALTAVAVGALVLVALNKYVVTAILFLGDQATAGVVLLNAGGVIFPYFLVPSGAGALWGLIPMVSSDYPDWLVSVGIAASLLLAYWLARRVLPSQVRAASAAASMVLLMAAMGTMLFYRDRDFGLFKLAMFVQPFLACVVAIELARPQRRGPGRIVRALATAIILSCLLATQYGYVRRGASDATEAGIPQASSLKVNRQFETLIRSIQRDDPTATVLSETSSIALAKMQSFDARGMQLLFPSRNFYFASILSGGSLELIRKAERSNAFSRQRLGNNTFEALRRDVRGGRTVYVYPLVKSDIFNSYGTPMHDERTYFKADTAPRDRIQFIHSTLGNHYYGAKPKTTAFSQLEPDWMSPTRHASSLGRHLLFELVNPSERPRVVMELSSTVVKQFESELPKARVQGAPMAFVGRGSARVFSEPIEPAWVDGVPYLSVDMMRDGRQFPPRSGGLMALYGREVPLDLRWITTFGRDISLVSGERYAALQAPSSLRAFPADLADPNLEYSGIYEDGWISELSYFVLSPRPDSSYLVLKGMIPLTADPNFSAALTLSLAGREIARKQLGLGAFEVKVPVERLAGRQRVGIAFDKYQRLPGEDGRIIGAKIDSLGFTEE